MKKENDPRAMFRCADMGDNLEEVVETEDCKVLRMNDSGDDGLMTVYRVVAKLIGVVVAGASVAFYLGGKVVQSGTHDELTEQGGIYRRFVESGELAVG